MLNNFVLEFVEESEGDVQGLKKQMELKIRVKSIKS